MLKKISHIMLISLILLTTMGMTVSKHYCGSSLESVGVLSTPEDCCKMPNECCHHESFTIKIQDDFSVTTHAFDFTQFAVVLPALVELVPVGATEKPSSVSFLDAPPPPKIQTVLSRLQAYLL
tara:strand:+ start:2536 stop:2904 length:369 start_codon:yes stop_codon:yes gene_type:complete